MRNKSAKENLVRYFDSGKRDLQDFQHLVVWSSRTLNLLKRTIEKEWLVSSLFLSMLFDLIQQQKAKKLTRMFTHECATLYAPWDKLLEPINKLHASILAVLNFHIGKQRDLGITRQLVSEIITRYKPLKPQRSDALYMAPGAYLRYFAEFFYSHKTYAEIFEPILRDLFDEHCKALHEKRYVKARRVQITYYWSFWSAVFAQLPISAVKIAYKIWKATH